jgi:hypothetical protein
MCGYATCYMICLIMRWPMWPCYLRHDLFDHEIACVAMVMLPVDWSARPCESFPCHVRWMDVFETIT